MEKRIGDLLADTDQFYKWAQGTIVALAALITIVQSGLPEVLRDEPRTIEDLAKELDLPPDKLARLVNFLAAHRIWMTMGSWRGQAPWTACSRSPIH